MTESEISREAWGLLAGLVYPPRFLDIARDLGLTPATLGALARLGEPRTMGEIAELLRCDPSNVTGIADALEARGLARRRPSESDRRVKAIALTAKGERMRQRVMGELSVPPEWLAALSQKDQRTLRDLLRRAADVTA
ncbi:MAG TPA: MarR family transcriptional regulator [Solirubrobacterales bacterium]|jgi:DNA-binding MarR family transcriptional regulator|nr:MarR family transcriptional regulator [Solirubrobacterales bacterium]